MTWFLFLLPMSILFLATAFFNRWPVQSLWVLAIMLVGPVWMMIREIAPKLLKNINTKYSLIFYMQKNLKKKNSEINSLRHEIDLLNHDLTGLHKMWNQSNPNAVLSTKLESQSTLNSETTSNENSELKSPDITKEIQLNVKMKDDYTYLSEELVERLFAKYRLKSSLIVEDEIRDVAELNHRAIQGKQVRPEN